MQMPMTVLPLFGTGFDGTPPNGLRISRAPARVTLIDWESNLQKTPDLDRPSRGVGWMRLLGGNRAGLYN